MIYLVVENDLCYLLNISSVQSGIEGRGEKGRERDAKMNDNSPVVPRAHILPRTRKASDVWKEHSHSNLHGCPPKEQTRCHPYCTDEGINSEVNDLPRATKLMRQGISQLNIY